MPINNDKAHLWKADTRTSVNQFNQWFMTYAPKAYRDTRGENGREHVEHGLLATEDFTRITPAVIKENPRILPTLRMSTCPPLARDRLIGLADSSKNLVGTLENGRLPPKVSTAVLNEHLDRITKIISRLLDVDIFPWLEEKRRPTEEERYRSSTIVADRLCGAIANPIVKNAQEKRQLAIVEKYLLERCYANKVPSAQSAPLDQMEPGTFTFRLNVKVTSSGTEGKTVNIPS